MFTNQNRLVKQTYRGPVRLNGFGWGGGWAGQEPGPRPHSSVPQPVPEAASDGWFISMPNRLRKAIEKMQYNRQAKVSKIPGV